MDSVSVWPKHVWLCSFADSRMILALKRLRKQAIEFGFVEDQIFINTEKDLDDEFVSRFKSKLILGSRGFGYWCWKPYVILKVLKNIPQGDILLWLDGGCWLNPKAHKRFVDYLDIVVKHGGLAFQGRSLLGSEDPDPLHHIFTTGVWTKGDLLDWFNVRHDMRIIKSGQIGSGIIFFRNDESARELVRKWYDAYLSNFHLADDTPSISPNISGFRENRHDQAIFSLLWLLNKYPTVSSCEVQPFLHRAPEQFIGDKTWAKESWDEMTAYPIWLRRDRGLDARSVRKLVTTVYGKMRSIWS